MDSARTGSTNSLYLKSPRHVRTLLAWSLVTAVCFSFLPAYVWSIVRWILLAGLCVEVVLLVRDRRGHSRQ
ncbi:hypothetical protein [Actinomyces procaprae]|uniref:hypothetical protein n=1 Tax=Actinomyces procaprae TaxID=2560010 RepID=UPI00109E2C7E|nr:hypothetical protein [Actinomyces procaprae]